jgi:hypothetical protein
LSSIAETLYLIRWSITFSRRFTTASPASQFLYSRSTHNYR